MKGYLQRESMTPTECLEQKIESRKNLNKLIFFVCSTLFCTGILFIRHDSLRQNCGFARIDSPNQMAEFCDFEKIHIEANLPDFFMGASMIIANVRFSTSNLSNIGNKSKEEELKKLKQQNILR